MKPVRTAAYLFSLLVVTAGIFVTLSTRSDATSLRIVPEAGKVILAWPAAASNYTLQFATQLPTTTNGWTNVNTPPAPVGNELYVTNEIGGQRFYRLMAANQSAPALTNFVAPPTLAFGSNGNLAFDFTDPDGDIAFVEIIRSNALGQTTSSVPAAVFAIGGGGGQASVALGSRQLAFGTNQLTLRLRDGGGRALR